MTRDEILQRFERLLDSAFETEDPPAGIPAELLTAITSDGDEDHGTDSYALWSAMTTLVQEVRLQGRAFQELNLTLGAQTEKTAAELRAVWGERERSLQREAERRCRREVLGALIDLRDRLARGLESARSRQAESAKKARTAWLSRLFARDARKTEAEALEALLRGYELGTERLDQTLDEFGAREIRCEGELFDPRRMNAIDSEKSANHADGAVLEVYRSGYEWNGEVFRPAQVKVARTPMPE